MTIRIFLGQSQVLSLDFSPLISIVVYTEPTIASWFCVKDILDVFFVFIFQILNVIIFIPMTIIIVMKENVKI